MIESKPQEEIDRLIRSAQKVVAAAQRPPGLPDIPPAPSVVSIVEGADGLPSVRIDSSWERTVPADELGAVVASAFAHFYRSPREQATRQGVPDFPVHCHIPPRPG